MGWFDTFTSLSNGTFIEDTINGIEHGLEQLERLADTGEEKLNAITNVADNAAEKLETGAQKASQVMDVVNKKIQ